MSNPNANWEKINDFPQKRKIQSSPGGMVPNKKPKAKKPKITLVEKPQVASKAMIDEGMSKGINANLVTFERVANVKPHLGE